MISLIYAILLALWPSNAHDSKGFDIYQTDTHVCTEECYDDGTGGETGHVPPRGGGSGGN